MCGMHLAARARCACTSGCVVVLLLWLLCKWIAAWRSCCWSTKHGCRLMREHMAAELRCCLLLCNRAKYCFRCPLQLDRGWLATSTTR